MRTAKVWGCPAPAAAGRGLGWRRSFPSWRSLNFSPAELVPLLQVSSRARTVSRRFSVILYANVSKLADSAECARRKPRWLNVNPPAPAKTRWLGKKQKTSWRMFLSRDSARHCLDVGKKITRVDHTAETAAAISANRKAWRSLHSWLLLLTPVGVLPAVSEKVAVDHPRHVWLPVFYFSFSLLFWAECRCLQMITNHVVSSCMAIKTFKACLKVQPSFWCRWFPVWRDGGGRRNSVIHFTII